MQARRLITLGLIGVAALLVIILPIALVSKDDKGLLASDLEGNMDLNGLESSTQSLDQFEEVGAQVEIK